MLDDLWFSDPTTHIFHEINDPRGLQDRRVLGVYRQRLDAANLKVRFAAQALEDVEGIIRQLEHGEFIYFDDASRLKASFNLEAFVVFLRAAIDTTLCAYAAYFTGKTTFDSVNDVLSKWPVTWIPPERLGPWEELRAAYDSKSFTWIHALAGREQGMSWRDLAVHKTTLAIDTIIDEKDRGKFVIALDKETFGPAGPWLKNIFDEALRFVLVLMNQVRAAEIVHAAALSRSP